MSAVSVDPVRILEKPTETAPPATPAAADSAPPASLLGADESPEYAETAGALPIYGLGAIGEQLTGTFTSSSKEIKLNLFEQKSNDETDVPSYGRGSTVVGAVELSFKKLSVVREVSIKVCNPLYGDPDDSDALGSAGRADPPRYL